MSTIRYTAKREIEKTGYNKIGVDISAAAADDSFNAVSTVLSGLADNDWVLVAGFANAANNGWFQANGASTATKITQDTTTALVTEAAGPSVTLTGYKRGLNQQYSIEFAPRALDRSAKIERQRRTALGGASETLFTRNDIFWNVEYAKISAAAMPQWREFLASVAGGESFTFDPNGSLAVPSAPVSVEWDNDSYTEERVGRSGLFAIGFKVRVLP